MCWTWDLLRMFATSPTTINKLNTSSTNKYTLIDCPHPILSGGLAPILWYARPLAPITSLLGWIPSTPLFFLIFILFSDHFFSLLFIPSNPSGSVLGCEMNEISDEVLLKNLCQQYLALLAGLPRIACRFVDRYRADYPQWLGGSTHSSTLISNIFLWK